MANRSAAERAAVSESTREEQPKKRTGKLRPSFMRGRWGADDAIAWFRWSSADIGFRAARLENPAETVVVGRKPLALWDRKEEDRQWLLSEQRKWETVLAQTKPGSARSGEVAWRLRNITWGLERIDDIPREVPIARIHGGRLNARPNKIGGTRVMTQDHAERINEGHMIAVRELRRIEVGMNALRMSGAVHYGTLVEAFLPRRLGPEIESAWGYQLSWLISRMAKTHSAYEDAQRHGKAKPFNDWLVAVASGGSKLINSFREAAELQVNDALDAYELAGAPPRHVAAQRARDGEKRVRGPDREPRKPSGIPFAPELDDA